MNHNSWGFLVAGAMNEQTKKAYAKIVYLHIDNSFMHSICSWAPMPLH